MKVTTKVFKYSIYGLISGLILLIPMFPILSLHPMFGLASVLGECFSDCVIGYKIACFIFLILAIIADLLYVCRILRKRAGRNGFVLSFCFNLLLYLLVHAFVFVAFVGAEVTCNGDGQLLLGIMYSGPISSVVIFVNGLMIDLIRELAEGGRKPGHVEKTTDKQ